MIKLSIIIPCLNECTNLQVLLPYLRQYSNNETEIIVCDGLSSSDLTAQICQDYKATYHKCKANQRATQMNSGAKLATGTTYLFLHADVLPPKDFSALISDTLSEGAGFGLFPYRFNRNVGLRKINAFFTRFKGAFCGGGDQGHFISSELFWEMGGYNTDYDIMEDFEFYGRIRKRHVPVGLAKGYAVVSARKYENNSYFRINLVNLTALIMFKVKLPQSMIKNLCSKLIKVS